MKPKGYKLLVFGVLAVLVLAGGFFVALKFKDGSFGNSGIVDYNSIVDDESDADGDGLTDKEEKSLGTNMYMADSDGDGYSDGEEIKMGYNPLAIQSGGIIDKDGDGLSGDDEEFYHTNPDLADTDFDGYSDGEEIASGHNPLQANLSEFVELNAIKNEVQNGTFDEDNQIVEITAEDEEQINYLEQAFSAQDIFTFQDNIVSYVQSSEGADTESKDAQLPEISNDDIKIKSENDKQAAVDYQNQLERIFDRGISSLSSDTSIDTTGTSTTMDTFSEFALFLSTTLDELADIEVPNDEQLIEKHKELIASFIKLNYLMGESIKNVRQGDQQSTVDLINNFSEITYLLYNKVMDEILPGIESIVSQK